MDGVRHEQLRAQAGIRGESAIVIQSRRGGPDDAYELLIRVRPDVAGADHGVGLQLVGTELQLRRAVEEQVGVHRVDVDIHPPLRVPDLGRRGTGHKPQSEALVGGDRVTGSKLRVVIEPDRATWAGLSTR
jgi:hypothetical protein